MIQLPFVTVITPTFNRAGVLPVAIRSVLGQDFSDFEYLIVDDGSTDDTAKIVKPFLSDPRIRYVRRSHEGHSKALQWAIMHAKTKFMAFLDSDDEYKPGHLSVLLSPLLKNPDLDFVLGNFELVLASKNTHHEVDDFFNPGKKIPVQQVEYLTGILAGKPEKMLLAGGFFGKLSDTRLILNMKRMGFRFVKIRKKTYIYKFGFFSDSVSFDPPENEPLFEND